MNATYLNVLGRLKDLMLHEQPSDNIQLDFRGLLIGWKLQCTLLFASLTTRLVAIDL